MAELEFSQEQIHFCYFGVLRLKTKKKTKEPVNLYESIMQSINAPRFCTLTCWL